MYRYDVIAGLLLRFLFLFSSESTDAVRLRFVTATHLRDR